MKTIIEDFSHIASRLNQIEQEKHAKAMATESEESQDWTPLSFTGPAVFTLSDDDFCC